MSILDKEYPSPLRPQPTWDIEDSTKLKARLDCPRKYFYEFVLGWRPERPSLHLEYGIAIHLAMEELLDGLRRNGKYSLDDIERGMTRFMEHYSQFWDASYESSNSPKNIENTLLMLTQYIELYKHESFKVLYTEIGGTVPVDVEGHLIHFKIDAIIEDEDGISIMDHKTTSRDSSMWREQWHLDVQMANYSHVLFLLYPPEKVFGAKVNGLILRKGENGFARIPVRKTREAMLVWQWQTKYRFTELDWYFDELSKASPDDPVLATFPRNENSCTKYGPCPYLPFCQAWTNPLRRCETPPPGFVESHWNPRAKAEEGARYKFNPETKDLEPTKESEQ